MTGLPAYLADPNPTVQALLVLAAIAPAVDDPGLVTAVAQGILPFYGEGLGTQIEELAFRFATADDLERDNGRGSRHVELAVEQERDVAREDARWLVTTNMRNTPRLVAAS